MYNNNEKGIPILPNDNHIKLLGIMFLFFLLTSNKKYFNNFNSKFNLKNIDDEVLEEKCRLLNRIKGYMNEEEQYIVHRAEVILEILGKVKSLIEGPQLHSVKVQYHSLSLEERKRNMLLDLSKHMKSEDREIIHTVIDLDIKARTIQKKITELNQLMKNGITLENMEKIVELVEPLLEEEIKNKTKDIKKAISMFKLMKALEEKGSLEEKDLIDIISPYVAPQQRDSLMKMMQIAKAVSSTMNSSDGKENTNNDENLKQTNPTEDLKQINPNETPTS